MDSCKAACHGMYADIKTEHILLDENKGEKKDTIGIKMDQEDGFDNALVEYLNYKRGHQVEYLRQDELSPFVNLYSARIYTGCVDEEGNDCTEEVQQGGKDCMDEPEYGTLRKCSYRAEELVEMVEIYFDTPTFDKITRDAKTNFVTMISLLGEHVDSSLASPC